MSDHTKVLVPLESWCYHSPEIRFKGGMIDIGLFAEALIYYDQIYINPTNPDHFSLLLSWFINQNKYSDFIAMLADGTLKIYEYSFVSAPIKIEDSWSVFNIQDSIQALPSTFAQRYLYHKSVQKCFKHARHKNKLYRALEDNVIEVKASDFGKSIENAYIDYLNSERNSHILQSFIDEISYLLNLSGLPAIKTVIKEERGKHQIIWNINIENISKLLGRDLNFNDSTPLCAAIQCNRFLWSSAQLNSDLFLGKPIGSLVGDKLFESALKNQKTQNLIGQLDAEVEFPDIRALVNSEELKLDDILLFRKKSKRFRKWLQDEGERDRNAIIAYHNQVAKEAGFTNILRKSLNLFGVLGGAYLGEIIAGNKGAVLGAAAGRGIEYLFDIASKLNSNWKPIVFGEWLKDRTKKISNSNKDGGYSQS